MNEFNNTLCRFLDVSPTPFHAVESMKTQLGAKGFTQLHETHVWGKLGAGRYFVTRNDSSLIAFTVTESELAETGIRMVGAHTDSPCLKVKPNPEKITQTLAQLGVEVYGGALLNPWFDRDLSMAGRVSYQNSAGHINNILIDFKRAIAIVPSLAIHLDREANKERSINPQLHLPPIVMQMEEDETFDFRAMLKQQVLKQYSDVDIDTVLDYEISLYDTQAAAITGLNGDFISSARLDNLLSCYIGLTALLDSDMSTPSLLVCTDHEEVGSMSTTGADGSFLESVLTRLAGSSENYHRMIQNSIMISADNAHAIHPNYLDKHDAEHGPVLNQGPVIKTNANQRYATNSETSALFRQLCHKSDVPVQDFVVRTDMACGSTIGPITSSALGVKTIDIGVPTFAMHSIRELAGSKDAFMLKNVLTHFYNNH
jgi:aspartyl aminopeptidase